MILSTLSIVIPTYQREQVLLETLHQLLQLPHAADELLVVDQTPQHETETESALKALHEKGKIVWIRKTEPSIPQAMNKGLLRAKGMVVLFLDDDIEVTSDLVREHLKEYENETVHAVAGRVVQSWERPLKPDASSNPSGLEEDPDAFLFNCGRRQWVCRFMGGNVSMRRDHALAVGGFDENFVRVAYRFEAEFADRFVAAGHRIVFQPKASIRHLQARAGGTRSYGEHLTTIRPGHAVGRYYYLLATGNIPGRARKFFLSPLLAFTTRFHLTHPWWIPVTLVAELGGLCWALKLWLSGPKRIDSDKGAMAK